MKKINCIIIDDEEIDRLMVLSFLKKFENFNVLGIFESASEALIAIENLEIDVAFLDIDMPKMNGLEFRKKTTGIPVCIYITDHPDHLRRHDGWTQSRSRFRYMAFDVREINTT